MLSVNVVKQFNAFTLDVAFESPGGITALFGPSGAGKTSIVNMIAGLMIPDRGRIVLDDDVLDDTSSHLHVPAHSRRIGYVFQDARLFPHLSVEDNLDYGRRMNGIPYDDLQHRRIVDMLDIGDILARRPGRLSGGERQRIALGRALLSGPRLLLLDEPLGALDDERKAEILPYLMRLRDEPGVPMIYVSHSASEVRQLATQVIMLRDGHVTGAGGVEILPQPTIGAF